MNLTDMSLQQLETLRNGYIASIEGFKERVEEVTEAIEEREQAL